MADNYQKFSEIMPSLTADERVWVLRVLDSQDGDVLRESGINLKAIDVEDWPGFQWEIDSRTCDLWLYAEEHGNVSHVGEFIRALLARFRPNDCWCQTWADTCSKPRVGEFGGGGLFVTARSAQYLTAGEWTARRCHAFHRRRTRRKLH